MILSTRKCSSKELTIIFLLGCLLIIETSQLTLADPVENTTNTTTNKWNSPADNEGAKLDQFSSYTWDKRSIRAGNLLTLKPSTVTNSSITTTSTSISQLQAQESLIPKQLTEDKDGCDDKINTNNQPRLVLDIEVTGSSVLHQEISRIINQYKGKLLTLEEELAFRDEITLLYIKNSYITSRACNPEIKDNGTMIIKVIEGHLNKKDITIKLIGRGKEKKNEEIPRLTSYIRNRIALAITTPLNASKLEEQLRLLKLDPHFEEIVPILSAKDGDSGASKLEIKVRETRHLDLEVGFSNYYSPSIGAEKFDLNLAVFSNLALYGDKFYLSGRFSPFLPSSKDSPIQFPDNPNTSFLWNFGYNIPFSSMNDTLELSFGNGTDDVVQRPFDQFNFRSESEHFKVNYRRPIIRSLYKEFAISVGYESQRNQTFVDKFTPFPFGFGPDKEGVSKTSVFTFGQDYLSRDQNGGGWFLQSKLNLGVPLFGATMNHGSIPDGQFVSWLGQAQYLQRRNDSNLLIAGLAIQLTPKGLLPSQQFVIGGANSLRGYRENVLSGDNGFQLSLEDNIVFLWHQNTSRQSREPLLQLIPFFDIGAVWNNSHNPNRLVDKTFLADIGIGFLWEPIQHLQLRLDYGVPLVDLTQSSSDLEDHGFHFRISYSTSFF